MKALSATKNRVIGQFFFQSQILVPLLNFQLQEVFI